MPNANVICEILGYKYRYFHDTETPRSLYIITALLLQCGHPMPCSKSYTAIDDSSIHRMSYAFLAFQMLYPCHLKKHVLYINFKKRILDFWGEGALPYSDHLNYPQ